MSILFGTVNRRTSNMTTISIPKKLANELELVHGERLNIKVHKNGNRIILDRHYSKKKE